MTKLYKQRFKYHHIAPDINLDDEEFCYWIGFFLADGCIFHDKEGSPKIILELAMEDENHLYKFRSWIRSNHPVKHIARTASARIEIRSQSIADLFNHFGITDKKSLTAKVNSRLKYNKHFWRGMIDGDGTLFRDGRDGLPTIGLLGTFDVCDNFRLFAIDNNIDLNSIKVVESGNIYNIRTCGAKAEKLIDILYRGSNIYLDRKYERAQKLW